MRSASVPALLAALVLAGCGLWPRPAAEPVEPAGPLAPPTPERVVLVTIDTLRADYVGCYGSNRTRTPTLDSIAASGVRFETAISPAPITLPSHASLLTGLDPPLHGVHHNGSFELAPGISTLAQHFRERGYATAAFVSAVVLDSRYGLDYGFDLYDDRMDYRRTTPDSGGHGERTADVVVDAALAWLEQAPDRFFLWIHLYDPHANYDPPAKYRPHSTRPPPDPAQVGFLAAMSTAIPPLYAGEIAFADAELGRFLGALRASHGDGTLLVVTSDHGESLGEHGELTHSLGIYDATQRVPLLMSGPGVPAGRVVSGPVRLVDVAPTLVSMAHLRRLPRTSGVDLTPWIRGERDEPLEVYLETLATYLDFGWSPVYGIRTQRYKYVRSAEPELYDLLEDPGESHNLAAEQPGVVSQLDQALAARLEGARPLQPTITPSSADRAQLEALGYVVASPARELPAIGWVGGPDRKERIGAVVSMMEARSYLAEGRPDEALAVLDSVPEAEAWMAEVRADAALAQGDASTAEVLARKATSARPDRAEAQVTLARALEELGRREEAGSAYEKAAEMDPSSSDSLVALGRLAEERGDLQAAADFYDRAAHAPTPNAEAALRLAALRFEEGRPSQARVLLQEAWNAPDAPAEARVRVAWAEARAGYPTLALQRLGAVLEQQPNSEPLEQAYTEIRQQFGTLHFPKPSKPGSGT